MFKLCVLYFLSAAFLNAQLPNDCSGALVVCDDSTLNLDALGTGVQELSGHCRWSRHREIDKQPSQFLKLFKFFVQAGAERLEPQELE